MKHKLITKHWKKCKKVMGNYYTIPTDVTEESLLNDLLKIRKSLIFLHSYAFGHEQDHRSGEETYNFCDGSTTSLFDMEYILDKVSYISDRFFCEFRLRWLLDLIIVLEKVSRIKKDILEEEDKYVIDKDS